MVTRITELEASYGKLSEILPEELNHITQNELETNQRMLQEIIAEDEEQLRQLLSAASIHIKTSDFADHSFIIRKAYPLRNEQFNRKPEIVKFYLARWWITREILTALIREVKDQMAIVSSKFTEFSTTTGLSRQRRISLIDFTRQYQNFIGYAVNILDIIAEYVEAFESTCKELDGTYKLTRTRMISSIHDFELSHGATELLLRGNTGRFTPAPLVRSLIESRITRGLLDTSKSAKHANKQIILAADFDFADIIRAVENQNITTLFQPDSVRRIYDWGSISIHRAWRMPHSTIWFALSAASTIVGQVNGATTNDIDMVLDWLIAHNKLCMTE